MLDKLFMTILDLTKTGSIVILAVIAVRFLLKKAPKVISYALWAVVLFRLLCPVTLELPVSAMPEIPSVQESYVFADIQVSPGSADEAAYKAIDNRFTALKGTENQMVPIATPDSVGKTVYVHMKWTDIAVIFGKYVWLLGVAAMVIYSIVSYARLRRRMAVKIPLGDGVYLADEISFPFVIGVFSPKIYLPSAMGEQEQVYVMAHERHHIRRLDPLWKALGFLALTLHWFNPLVWVAFILAGKDMEMSCDEAVIRRMGAEVRADYAQSLASLATDRRSFTGVPLAFAEGDPKMRIRNLANWKKPVVWVVVMSVILSVVLAGCLLVDPVKTDTKPTVPTEPAGTSPQQAEGTVDIRPMPPKDPGSSLIEYDPNRQIYIASENIYMDYYPGITGFPSFYFYIFSKEELKVEEITVTFPVDLPFFLDIAQVQGIERKPQIIPVVDDETLEANDFVMSFNDGVCLPFYVYQAYRNVSFGTKEAESQQEKIYADFVSLTEEDIPAFYVYSISVAFIDIQELEEVVVLEKLDIAIGGQTYEAKLGRVRMLPTEAFPADVPVAASRGTMGSYYQLYNDGLFRIPGVLEWIEIPEDRTLTGLYMAEEESQVLDILVTTIVNGQEMQMRWDGKTPIYLYKGDSVYIDVVLKNELTEKLLNYVMFHTVVEYQDGSGEMVCAVFADTGSLISNFHEYYAIIFDGLDMEPYYRKSYYKLGALSWRSAYLK